MGKVLYLDPPVPAGPPEDPESVRFWCSSNILRSFTEAHLQVSESCSATELFPLMKATEPLPGAEAGAVPLTRWKGFALVRAAQVFSP